MWTALGDGWAGFRPHHAVGRSAPSRSTARNTRNRELRICDPWYVMWVEAVVQVRRLVRLARRACVWLVGYVLAVAKSHRVTTRAVAGPARADQLAAALPSRAWNRLSAGIKSYDS
jgi:hypothetical protein